MTKVVRKIFFSWQEEKEKAFLETMAKDGYRLSGANTGKYIFDSCEPANLIYEVDFRGDSFDDLDDYRQIHEDAGWMMVADKGGWYFFCKELSDDQNNSLFNNNASKLEKYRRMLSFIGSLWATSVFFIFTSLSFSIRQEAAMSVYLINLILLLAFVVPALFFFRVWLKFHKLKSKISE